MSFTIPSIALRHNQNEPKLGTNSLMLVPAAKSFKGCFRPGNEEDAIVILVNLTVELLSNCNFMFSILHQDLNTTVIANFLKH
jgi:hypothetical protein